MSNDKSPAPAHATQAKAEEPKKKKDIVVVRLLRPVKGVVNNVGEICGFPAALAQKLLDKNRQGGPLAELYEPPKK